MIPYVVGEFKAISVKQGQSLFIPSNYGHLIINTGQTYFVTADDSPVDFEEHDSVSLPGHADYELVKQMQGFAYYIIEHDGKPALKKNPRYKKINKEEFNDLPVLE